MRRVFAFAAGASGTAMLFQFLWEIAQHGHLVVEAAPVPEPVGMGGTAAIFFISVWMIYSAIRLYVED